MSNPPAWSFSSLNSFQNCPLQYKLTRVTKEVKTVESEAMRYGTECHLYLENRMAKKAPLPEHLLWLETAMVTLERSGGQPFTEQKMSVTKGLEVSGWFDKDTWCRGVVDVGVRYKDKSVVLDYKGLALNTPIPTPDGWSTMGELKGGARVFGGDGSVCYVTTKSEIHHRDCYEMVFDDGARIVCDDEHLWVTNGEVKSTKEIAETLLRYEQKHHKVELHPGLSLPDVELPVHPYVLGAWLGDGKHSSGEICKPDQELWDNIVSCGYEISHDYSERAGRGHAPTRTVKGLRTQLRKAGLLKNKHIPEIYLRAGHEQRLQLLQGLMDTDGSGNKVRKQAVFTTCDKRLSDSVVELLLTLGQRPLQCSTTQRGFGLVVTAWPVHFRPTWGLIPFRMSRKQAKIAGVGAGNSWRRVVVECNKVPSVPTQCIAVDSCDATYLCGDRMVVTHNTGKRKFDSDQLMLFAGFEFTYRPEVQEVRTGYVWLKDKKIDSETFTRDDIPRIWRHFIPKVERLEKAYEKDEWPAKSSGLCGWCSATKAQCKHAKR